MSAATRSTNAVRATIPRRAAGGRSFDSTTSNDGRAEDDRRRLTSAREPLAATGHTPRTVPQLATGGFEGDAYVPCLVHPMWAMFYRRRFVDAEHDDARHGDVDQDKVEGSPSHLCGPLASVTATVGLIIGAVTGATILVPRDGSVEGTGHGGLVAGRGLRGWEPKVSRVVGDGDVDVGNVAETRRSVRVRSFASAVLMAVAIVTAPLLIVAVWADQQITDTDRYVEAVSGLSDDPRVQQYVASELAKAFSEHVDVDAELKKVLPQELQSLSPTLTSGLDGFVEAAAGRFTASSAFHTIWVDANRAAHRVLVAVLTGERDAVSLSDGRLTIDLGDALRDLQRRLVDEGLAVAGQVDLSGVDRQVVLADGTSVEAIENARELLGNLQDLVWTLAALTILTAVSSVLVAPRRRRRWPSWESDWRSEWWSPRSGSA